MTRIDPGPAARWWRGLQPSLPDGRRNPTGDRAALARLRRASLAGTMAEPATFGLFRDLGLTDPADLPRAALCAAVLAMVREDEPRHPARALGAPPGGPAEAAVLKPLRFRRLIEAETAEEQLIAFRRAVRIAGGTINVRRVADACLNWSDPTRRTWLFEYHNAGFAAPPDGQAPDAPAADAPTADAPTQDPVA